MRNEIQEQFNKVIEHSQGFYPNTDLLFDNWEKNKKWFIDAFGGNLILDCGPVSFALDKKTKEEKISEFLDSIDLEYHLYDLTSFIDEQRETFYNNETCKDYNYHGTKIPAGAKLVKSFKHFITNEVLLNEIQSRASMIIQDDKIHGNLCISVHPLDFLSTSETTYKWRSCHALDGEYRAGNLSYMQDRCTVICYLRSKKEEILPNFPRDVRWNSKKWRCLLFFSEEKDAIFYGRQYPVFSQDAMMQVLVKMLKHNVIHGVDWCNPYKDRVKTVPCEWGGEFRLDQAYYPVEGQLFGIEDMVEDCSDLHFNDLLRSSCYTPYLTRMYTWSSKREMPKFKIGSEVKCLSCGQDYIELTDSGTMLCPSCNSDGEDWDGRTYWCDYCGNGYDQDDIIFVDGLAVCPECTEERVAECSVCGQLHLKQNSIIGPDGKWYCGNAECFRRELEPTKEDVE